MTTNSLQEAADKAAPLLPYAIASKELPITIVPGGQPEHPYSTGRPSIASTDASNPYAPISIQDQKTFENPDNTPQLLTHEMAHQVQKQWAPEILKSLPPINPNDPYGGTDAEDLKKIDGDPRKLSLEQQAAVFQKVQAMKQRGEKIDPIYHVFNRKFGEIPLSTIMPTDPNQKGINTTPRTPGLPADPVWGTEHLLHATDVIPVPVGSGTNPNLAKDIQASKTDITKPAPQPQKEEEGFRLTSNFSTDKRDARIAAVKNPAVINPLTFQNPTDRQAATFARAQRIVGDAKFKALPPEHQVKVLGNYYDKYVQPAYESAGLHAPNKDLWIRAMPKNSEGHGATDVNSFYLSDNARSTAITAASVESGAGELAGGITYAGIRLSQTGTRVLLHLANFFGAPVQPLLDNLDKSNEQTKAAIGKINNAVFDNANFWLQTHPSKNWVDHVDAGIGEALVQLPLYDAIGAARLGIAAKAQEAASTGMLSNLTKVLADNPKGAFVARRLGEATDAYMGGLLQGSQNKIGDMLAFMGFGAATEGLGAAISYPSKMLIKKFTSTNLAVGGKPFQEAVTDEAAYELEHGIHATEADLKAHLQDDPAKAGPVTAEKMTLSAMGRQKYNKPWNQLSHSQRNSIRAVRQQLTQETMAELPIHQPEIAQANAEKQVEESKAQSPVFAKRVEEFEKQFGLKVSKLSAATEADRLQNQVGIKNAQDTIAKIGSNKTKAKYTPEQKVAMEQEPKTFAQLKMDTIAYFKNPYSKQGVKTKELQKWLKDLPSEDFIQDLKDEMGAGKYKFENSDHALLWANHFRSELPKPMANRLIQELHERYPNQTIADWNRASENLERHMDYLATTGRLQTQKNIFRTTQVTDWTDKTKWQKQLLSEVEDTEFDKLARSLDGHPEVKKIAMRTLKQLQAARRMAASPEADRLITKQIHLYDAKRAKLRVKSKAVN